MRLSSFTRSSAELPEQNLPAYLVRFANDRPHQLHMRTAETSLCKWQTEFCFEKRGSDPSLQVFPLPSFAEPHIILHLGRFYRLRSLDRPVRCDTLPHAEARIMEASTFELQTQSGP